MGTVRYLVSKKRNKKLRIGKSSESIEVGELLCMSDCDDIEIISEHDEIANDHDSNGITTLDRMNNAAVIVDEKTKWVKGEDEHYFDAEASLIGAIEMATRILTVSKLIAHLQSFPGEMLVFDIDDYYGICEPIENSSSLPCVESVTEIEFQSTKRRCFHSGSRDSLVPHDVIRTIDVLAL